MSIQVQGIPLVEIACLEMRHRQSPVWRRRRRRWQRRIRQRWRQRRPMNRRAGPLGQWCNGLEVIWNVSRLKIWLKKHGPNHTKQYQQNHQAIHFGQGSARFGLTSPQKVDGELHPISLNTASTVNKVSADISATWAPCGHAAMRAAAAAVAAHGVSRSVHLYHRRSSSSTSE